jgi:hypothetical protein
MYAKVKNNELVKFPYGFSDLQTDNPHSIFSGVLILLDLFNETEEKLLKGYDLVEVKQLPTPKEYNFQLQKATLNDQPTLNENGEWELGWTISFLSPSEIASERDKLKIG